jgi:hypothetical protein
LKNDMSDACFPFAVFFFLGLDGIWANGCFLTGTAAGLETAGASSLSEQDSKTSSSRVTL